MIASGDGEGLGVTAELHRRDAVEALAIALLERDRYTGEHSESVVEMAVSVAQGLGLSPAQVEDVRAAALLHDIGKVGIPDAILNKPGPLTPDERPVMAEHPVIGERILRGIGGFAPVADIVRHEHESYDGSRLSRRARRRRHPDRQPDHPRLRRLPRDDERPALPGAHVARRRLPRAAPLRRPPVRPDVTAALVARFYHERAGRAILRRAV